MAKYEIEYRALVTNVDTATVEAEDEFEAINLAQREAEKIYGELDDFYAYEVNKLNG